MKRILIPTDFSDNAWNAFVYASELYKEMDCDFFFINVFEMQPVYLLAGSTQNTAHIFEAVKARSVAGLKMILEDIESIHFLSDNKFKTESVAGPLVPGLKKTIKEHKIDLIIMSPIGETGSKEVLMGSHAKKIVSQISECPILIVPVNAEYSGIAEIAFATSLKKQYHSLEIKTLMDFADSLEAIIRIINVHDKGPLSTVQLDNLNTLKHQIKDIEYRVHVISSFSSIEKAIQTVLTELELELLVMINYKHNLIDKLWREAVIKKMVFHSKIPLLVIPQAG